MRACTVFAAVVAASALAGGSPPAHAGGGGMTGGATEVTQLLNNAELAAQLGEQVRMVAQLADQYRTQVQQWEEQVRNGLSISGITLNDVLEIKGQIDGYQQNLRTYGRDLQSLESAFDVRRVESRLSGLSFSDYLQRESQRIAQGNQAAKARVQYERQLMEQVRKDGERTAEYGRKLQTRMGQNESIGLLNAQTNLMTQQLGRLIELTAQGQLSDKAMGFEAENKDRDELLKLDDAIRARRRQVQQEQQRAIDHLRRGRQ